MPTIFSRIIQGEIPCHRITEDDHFLAFLDINPVHEGHVLVVPKIEVDYLFDLEDQTLQAMILFAKKIAQGLRRAVPCNRVGVTVIGLEVPHAHIHLIPISTMDDMNFFKPKANPTHTDLAAIAERIRKHIVD